MFLNCSIRLSLLFWVIPMFEFRSGGSRVSQDQYFKNLKQQAIDSALMVAPASIVSTTRLRKSSEYGFAIHAGLLPVGSLNQIRAGMGIPDSAFSGNALRLSIATTRSATRIKQSWEGFGFQ
jgi:hypothetical protein